MLHAVTRRYLMDWVLMAVIKRNLMESFLQSGDRNIEQFMEEYQEKRKLAHLRRIKVSRDLCNFTLICLDSG